MQTYGITGNDHPYSGQARCDCGAFLRLEPDEVSEEELFDKLRYLNQWRCSKCGKLHERLLTKE